MAESTILTVALVDELPTNAVFLSSHEICSACIRYVVMQT